MNAIEIKNLLKVYGTKKVVNSISLNVKEGSLFALLGVNGAGKTTTIRMLSGLTEISGGEAYILGKSVKNDLEEVKKLINISPQDTAVALNLTVKENLEFIADIYNCDDKEEVKKIVEKFSLDEVIICLPSYITIMLSQIFRSSSNSEETTIMLLPCSARLRIIL